MASIAGTRASRNGLAGVMSERSHIDQSDIVRQEASASLNDTGWPGWSPGQNAPGGFFHTYSVDLDKGTIVGESLSFSAKKKASPFCSMARRLSTTTRSKPGCEGG